jgi:branched-chain amino acid transport system permease protein
MIGGYLALMMLSSVRLPLPLAILATMGLMALLGFVVERGILRPLTGYPVVSVIMATIGLAAIMRGIAPMVWTAEVRGFPAILPSTPFRVLGVPLAPINLASAGLALSCMVVLGYFFQRTRYGIAMRAVSDDPRAAAAMGIDLRTILALAWAIAGMVSALGGVIWGRILGVDPYLAIVGLKVFPVVILGGLDSIMGAVPGRRLRRPPGGGRGQGRRALRRPDRGADGAPVWSLRPRDHRARMTGQRGVFGGSPC